MRDRSEKSRSFINKKTIKENESGFTLLEVMLVVVILSILAAVAIPRLTGSSESAREKADITTGSEVKAALDRYQVEKGSYPTLTDMTAAGGNITCAKIVPEYIKSLKSSVTQQNAEDGKKGFAVLATGDIEDNTKTSNLIMIYLDSNGSAAEVKVFDKTLANVLWSSI